MYETNHATQKVTHTPALLVILIISTMALGACFHKSVEGTHHASTAQALPVPRYRVKSFQP